MAVTRPIPAPALLLLFLPMKQLRRAPGWSTPPSMGSAVPMAFGLLFCPALSYKHQSLQGGSVKSSSENTAGKKPSENSQVCRTETARTADCKGNRVRVGDRAFACAIRNPRIHAAPGERPVTDVFTWILTWKTWKNAYKMLLIEI